MDSTARTSIERHSKQQHRSSSRQSRVTPTIVHGDQPPGAAGPQNSSTRPPSRATVAAAPSLESVCSPLFDLEPSSETRRLFVNADVVETTIQNVPELTEHTTNTEARRVTVHRGMRHVEGGWPKDVDAEVSDQTIKYRKKIEKDDAYFAAVAALCATVTPLLRQNAAINVYETFTFATGSSSAVTPSVESATGSMEAHVPSMLVQGAIVDPATHQHRDQSSHSHVSGAIPPPRQAAPSSCGLQQSTGVAKAVQFDTNVVDADDDERVFDAQQRSVTAISFSSQDASRPTHVALAFARRSIGHTLPGGPFASALGAHSRTRHRWSPIQGTGSSLADTDDVDGAEAFCYSAASTSFATGETCDSYIYDASRPSQPAIVLHPHFSLRSLEFHPRDAHLVVGGTVGGTVVQFDTRRGSLPVMSSPVAMHRDIVPKANAGTSSGGGGTTNTSNNAYPAWTLRQSPSPILHVKWLQSSGKANEVATADGSHRVLVWDIRSMTSPVDIITVGLRGSGVDPAEAYRHGCLCVDFAASSPTSGRLLAGTTTGCVMALTRRGRIDSDRVAAMYGSHSSPVLRVTRHPVFASLFATAADRAVNVWVDDQVEALVSLDDGISASGRVVDCAWHPTVPQLLLVLHLHGQLCAWALGVTHNAGLAPGGMRHLCTVQALSTQKTASALATTLAISADGTQASVGATNGTAVMVSLQGLLDEFSTVESTTTTADPRTTVSHWIAHHKKGLRGIHDSFRGTNTDASQGLLGTLKNRDLMHRAAVILRQGGLVAGGLTSDDVAFDDLPSEEEQHHAASLQRRSGGSGATQRQYLVGDDELPDEERDLNVWSSAATLSKEIRSAGAQFLAQLVGDELPGTYHDTVTDAWAAAALSAEETIEYVSRLPNIVHGTTRPGSTRSGSPVDTRASSTQQTPMAPRATTPSSMHGAGFRKTGRTPPPRHV